MKRTYSLKFAWLAVAGSLPLACALLGSPALAQPQAVSGEIVVNTPPPPVVVEAQPESPGPDYVFVPGAWTWNDGWVWEKGHYARPPGRGEIWVPNHYEVREGRQVFLRGGWRGESIRAVATEPGESARAVATEPGEVVVSSAPPPAVVEAQPESPGPDYVFVPGAWTWNNGWVWEKGHYDRPPATGEIWVAPQYEDRDGRHVYVRGEWRDESKKERKLERKLEHEREHEEDHAR